MRHRTDRGASHGFRSQPAAKIVGPWHFKWFTRVRLAAERCAGSPINVSNVAVGQARKGAFCLYLGAAFLKPLTVTPD